MKKEIALAESDPDVDLNTLTSHVYVDNDKREKYIIQIISEESFTKNQLFPKGNVIDVKLNYSADFCLIFLILYN